MNEIEEMQLSIRQLAAATTHIVNRWDNILDIVSSLRQSLHKSEKELTNLKRYLSLTGRMPLQTVDQIKKSYDE